MCVAKFCIIISIVLKTLSKETKQFDNFVTANDLTMLNFDFSQLIFLNNVPLVQVFLPKI